jgi:hypothetical protein
MDSGCECPVIESKRRGEGRRSKRNQWRSRKAPPEQRSPRPCKKGSLDPTRSLTKEGEPWPTPHRPTTETPPRPRLQPHPLAQQGAVSSRLCSCTHLLMAPPSLWPLAPYALLSCCNSFSAPWLSWRTDTTQYCDAFSHLPLFATSNHSLTLYFLKYE